MKGKGKRTKSTSLPIKDSPLAKLIKENAAELLKEHNKPGETPKTFLKSKTTKNETN